jgi:hypothetical protein
METCTLLTFVTLTCVIAIGRDATA